MATPPSGPHSNRVGQKHDLRPLENHKKGIKKASFLDIITFRGKKITLDGQDVWVNKASLAKFVQSNLPPPPRANSHIGFFDHIFVTDKTLKGLKQLDKSHEMVDMGVRELGIPGEEEDSIQDIKPSADQRISNLARRALSSHAQPEDLQEAPGEPRNPSRGESIGVSTPHFSTEEVQILIRLGETLSTIQNAGPSDIKRLRQRIERETEEVRDRDREAREAGTASSRDTALQREIRAQKRGSISKEHQLERLETLLETPALGFSDERTTSGGVFQNQQQLGLFKTTTKPPEGIKQDYRIDFTEKTKPLAAKDIYELSLRDALTAILNHFVKEFYSLSINNSNYDWDSQSSSSKMLEIKIKQFREIILPYADLLQIDGKATLMKQMPHLSKMAAEFFHEFYAFRSFDKQYSQAQMKDFMASHFQDASKK